MFSVCTDDECFYVGLGHGGRVKKKDAKARDERNSFKCCPCKVERNTKVTQMSAQRISRRDDKNRQEQFRFAQSEEDTKPMSAEKKAESKKAKKAKKPEPEPVAKKPKEEKKEKAKGKKDEGGLLGKIVWW